MNISNICNLICLLFTLILMGAGCTHTSSKGKITKTDKPKTGCIAGIVFESGSKIPLRDAATTIYTAGSTLDSTTLVSGGMSDSVGRFVACGLSEGSYTMVTYRIGYNCAEIRNVIVKANSVSVAFIPSIRNALPVENLPINWENQYLHVTQMNENYIKELLNSKITELWNFYYR